MRGFNTSQCLGWGYAAACRRAKSGAQLSWDQVSAHISNPKGYLEFPAVLAGRTTAEPWGPALNCLPSHGQGHGLSPIPGHYAPAKLCNRPLVSKAGRWGVGSDWREMGRLWQPFQGITTACELRWMKTFKIKLLRLVPGNWLTEPLFLSFVLLCLVCCFWQSHRATQ